MGIHPSKFKTSNMAGSRLTHKMHALVQQTEGVRVKGSHNITDTERLHRIFNVDGWYKRLPDSPWPICFGKLVFRVAYVRFLSLSGHGAEAHVLGRTKTNYYESGQCLIPAGTWVFLGGDRGRHFPDHDGDKVVLYKHPSLDSADIPPNQWEYCCPELNTKDPEVTERLCVSKQSGWNGEETHEHWVQTIMSIKNGPPTVQDST